ncbi:MAG: VWA domain-containing protein [Candidatus Pacebacteria bacterium]|nr:VWA domain-containing protein [Candidatus Paceibacterota bacterium]
MKTNVLLPVFFCLCFIQGYSQKETPCLYADIVIVSDFSGSMNGDESFVVSAVDQLISGIPPEQNKIRFGLVSFVDVLHLEMLLTHRYDSLQKIVDWYFKRKAKSFETNLAPALSIAGALFRDSISYYPRNRIIIIITDGVLNDEYQALAMANTISEKFGITICAISPSLGDNLQIGPISPKPFSEVRHDVLFKLSGGNYFFNDVETLKEGIRKRGLCL